MREIPESKNGWVVVTGGASGIGRELVRRFSAASPVLAIDVDRGTLESAVGDLEDVGNTIVPCVADVGDEREVDRALANLSPQARVRCLVNCAGIVELYPAQEMPLTSFDRVLRANLTGAFIMAQRCFTHFDRGSVVVNVGSINGHRALPNRVAYSVSKAGLLMLTQCLAVEWGSLGIRAVSVSPGIVDTPMNRRVEELRRSGGPTVETRVPLGRQATVEEIGAVIEFVASPSASYLSGADVVVDGGWTAYGAM